MLLLLLMLCSVGCRTGQPATSTATEFKLTLLSVPQETIYDLSDCKWGYIDTAGNWVIQPRFEAAWQFLGGLAPVRLDGKWGYIDETGSMVIEPQFNEAYYFHEGLARVATGPPPSRGQHLEKASGYGFIDEAGRVVIPAEWDAADDFHEGLAAVMSGSGCGFVNTRGELIIPTKFDAVGSFSEGLAQAAVNGKCGYIDTKGEWKISPQYEAPLTANGVLANGATALLGGRFKSGLAPVYVEGDPLGGGKCQYIDNAGKKVFPQVFQRGGEFSEGLAPVCVDDKWGFIDTSGRMVIEPQYGSPSGEPFPFFYLEPGNGFHDGLAMVALDGKLGYIDKNETFAVAPQYVYGTGFLGGFAYVHSKTRLVPDGVIDVTGRLIYLVSLPPGSSSTTSP